MRPSGQARRAPYGLFVGLATLDVIQRVPRIPQRNAKVTALRQDIAGGGPALNAAVIFSALGGHATLVTRLGTSSVSALIRADLEAHQVEIVDVADADYVPAVSTITIDAASGDRQIVSTDALGASDRSSPSHSSRPSTTVEAAIAQAAMHADLVHIDGHHSDLAMEASKVGARRGKPRVLDAGRWKPVMADLIPTATDVIYSADFSAPGHERDLLEWTIQQGARLAAVTHGSDPTEWRTSASHGQVAAERVEVVDTLGAGDFFHGAYSFARATAEATARTKPVTDYLRFASQVAAVKCTRPGTRSWLAELGPTSPFDHTME